LLRDANKFSNLIRSGKYSGKEIFWVMNLRNNKQVKKLDRSKLNIFLIYNILKENQNLLMPINVLKLWKNLENGFLSHQICLNKKEEWV